MSTRSLHFSVDEYYHIYNRGTDKRDIFLDEEDKIRFIKLLFVANGSNPFVFRDFPIGVPYVNIDRGQQLTAIGAYCLMSNHFHILLRETNEGGISKFIGKMLTSYSSYFNKKYKRTGALFEGAFKATYVKDDRYLKYLLSYIHLNPVKFIDSKWKENGIGDLSKTKEYLEKYPYSSYLDYTGGIRKEKFILDQSRFPEYFANFNEFNLFIDGWLAFNQNNV